MRQPKSPGEERRLIREGRSQRRESSRMFDKGGINKSLNEIVERQKNWQPGEPAPLHRTRCSLHGLDCGCLAASGCEDGCMKVHRYPEVPSLEDGRTAKELRAQAEGHPNRIAAAHLITMAEELEEKGR